MYLKQINPTTLNDNLKWDKPLIHTIVACKINTKEELNMLNDYISSEDDLGLICQFNSVAISFNDLYKEIPFLLNIDMERTSMIKYAHLTALKEV